MLNPDTQNEIKSGESIVVLRNSFEAACPACRKPLKDITSIERDANWLYYSTRFECDKDKYWMMTRIEEFNAIESDIGQDISEVKNSDHAAVKLDTHLSVLRDLISEGVENYMLDRIEQKCNDHGEYFITRSMSDGNIDGLAIYFAKLAKEYSANYELSKSAIAMKFAIDYLESTNFSDHHTIISITGSEAEGQKLVRRLIAACRGVGQHSKAKRIEAELSVHCS